MQRLRVLVALSALTLVLAACGDGTDTATPDTATPDSAATDSADAETAGAAADVPTEDPSDPASADDPAYANTEAVTPDPGGPPTTVTGAIIAGTADAYTVEVTTCCAGETLYAQAFSPEGNAVVMILGPGGEVLASETADVTIDLTQTGVHTIVVGSTRGNAEYELDLGIAVDAS